MASPVVHFEIACKDVDTQQGFYEKVLGWNVQTMPQMDYRMVSPTDEEKKSPAIGGGLVKHPGGQSFVTVCAHVDDVQEYLDKAVAAGGPIVLPVTEIGEDMGSMGMFIHPEGNAFCLFKPSPQG